MITNQDYLKNLVRELTKLPYETEWVEFKVNNIEPQMIGEYISELSNSATLFGRTKGYLIWGIEDKKRTCYMLSCLKYVSEGAISNSDVREVFGFSEKDKAKATRIIKDTLNAGLIKIVDKNTAPRYMKYIPFWG